MKKFFLALGVVAMMFGVAACGGDPAYKSAKNDFCKKIQQCDEEQKCNDIDIKGDCEDEAKANYECLNGLSCEALLAGGIGCESKQEAFDSCQEGKGGNGDDDDDEEGGNGGDDDDDEGGYGGNGGDDDDDDFGGDDGGDDDIDIDIDFE